MKIHLIDLNSELVEYWGHAFAPVDFVEVSLGNILRMANDTIVSPANSYGYMDGGIDRAYRDYFGISIEQTVQAKIALREEKYLPVGEAILVPTGDEQIPQMICAPTMFLPEPVPAEHCYLAMRAAVQCALSADVKEMYCPGMATGIGRVSPKEAANEMLKAVIECAES